MDNTNVQVTTLDALAEDARTLDAVLGSRPLVAHAEGEGDGTTTRKTRANQRTPRIVTPRGLTVNSMLRESEWQVVDRAVLEAALPPLVAVNDLRSRGLVAPIGSIGTMVRQWYAQSEMSAAEVSMTGQSRSLDMLDLKQFGAPIPVVFKDFTIDARTLAASRLMGDGLDTTTASAAARVVAETLESLLVNGGSVVLNGLPLYGFRSHPNRATDTATNYGGGDWADPTKVVPTIAGMINALFANHHYGPYTVYVAPTQYNQATLTYFADGSGETPAQRVQKIPSISAFRMLPSLNDGEVLVVQMGREVVEWNEAADVQVREWVTGDGMTANFKVLAIAGPAVKARYDGRSGICHATGA